MGKKRAPSSKPLFQAIEAGDLDKVQEQIAAGVNVNALRRDDGYTPLGLAVENASIEIARVLLHAGADANRGGVVPVLNQAICSGHEALVRLLLECGANANARDEDDYTPLMHAAAAGNLGIVKLLLARGADPRPVEEDEDAAVVQAAHAGHAEIVDFLAPHSPPSQVERARQVLPLGQRRKQRGRDPFVQRLRDLAAANDLNGLRQAVAEGADVNAQNESGESALFLAAWLGRLEFVNQLLEFGADVNLKDDCGRVPLFDVCRAGSVEMVQILLDAGADPRAANRFGDTLLHQAACGRCPDIVRLLVDHGADLAAKNWQDRTPLAEAAHSGFSAMVELLLKLGADTGGTATR